MARASWVCMQAGADFIKTSTGKETINATLPYSLVMVRAIREYLELTGHKVGYKPAGGISKAADQLGVAKSGVSRRLSALEDRLGTPLITRTTRSLSLNLYADGRYTTCTTNDLRPDALAAFLQHRIALTP